MTQPPPDYAALFSRFYAPIRQYIYRQVGDPWLAEDLAGDVFVKAISAEGRGDGARPSHQAWLYQIAKNLLIDYYRARARRNRRGATASLDDVRELPVADPTTDIPDRELARAAIAEALQDVSVHYRDVVLMRLEGYTIDEVARALDLPTGTVKTRQHRGYTTMRNRLQQLLEQEPTP